MHAMLCSVDSITAVVHYWPAAAAVSVHQFNGDTTAHHSPVPLSQLVWSSELRRPLVAFFADCDIDPHKEVVTDYGVDSYWANITRDLILAQVGRRRGLSFLQCNTDRLISADARP